MLIAHAATFAGNLFRVSYQSMDAIYQYQVQLHPSQTISELIAETFKNHIALLDTCLTVGQYAFGLESHIAWIVPFRIAAVAHGIYQLQSDPNADSKSITLEIFLNLLNINQIAMARFSRNATIPAVQNFYAGAALACVVGDAALRMGMLYVNRTSLINRVKDIYGQGFTQNVGKAKDILYTGGDYAVRTALATTVIFILYDMPKSFLTEGFGLPSKTINEIIGWTTMTAVLSFFIAEAVHKIFDDMGLQASKKRGIVELSFSTLTSSFLIAAAAVGTGRATSVLEIFKPICRSALTVAIVCTLGYLFKTAASQIADAFGVPSGFERNVKVRLFSVISSLTLTAMASAGFGLTKTISDSGIVMGKTVLVGISAFYLYFSLSRGANILLFGTPSWNNFV